MNNQTNKPNNGEHMSGFAKKKALEAAGFSVQKLHNPSKDAEEWCVLDGPNDGAVIIAANRLQGVAVVEAIEKLGGL